MRLAVNVRSIIFLKIWQATDFQLHVLFERSQEAMATTMDGRAPVAETFPSLWGTESWKPDCSSSTKYKHGVPTSVADTCLFHLQGFFEVLQVDLPIFSRNGLKLLCHPLKPLGVLLGSHCAGRQKRQVGGFGVSKGSGGLTVAPGPLSSSSWGLGLPKWLNQLQGGSSASPQLLLVVFKSLPSI